MTDSIALMRTAEYHANLDQCIHCGMCLEACPTYAIGGSEMDSPRGRIALMRAVSDGRVSLGAADPAFVKHINLCLGCLACETACPSGVQYGALVEPARVAIEHSRTPGPAERAVRWLGLRQMMPHVGRLKLMARLLWLYERSGLQRVVRGLNVLPQPLKAMEAILPPIVPTYRDHRAPARAIGERRGAVAMLHGCIQEAFLSPVNEATVRVLQRNGYDVLFPRMQTCCGAAQLHTGDLELARDLAHQNIDAFLALGVEAFVTNAGGCGHTLKQYAHVLHNDLAYRTRAQMFVDKVQDINEFLADHLHQPPQVALPATVTYVDSCHLRHGQRVAKQPRALLRSIPGVRLVELKQPDRCCGSAGVYNITQPDTADVILDAKMADVAATGAQIVAVSNTGCHMQIIAGVRKAGLPVEVLHVVELLDRSYNR